MDDAIFLIGQNRYWEIGKILGTLGRKKSRNAPERVESNIKQELLAGCIHWDDGSNDRRVSSR